MYYLVILPNVTSNTMDCVIRISEMEGPLSQEFDTSKPISSSFSKLECVGMATGLFVLARCLQLGMAVAKNEPKAMDCYARVQGTVV